MHCAIIKLPEKDILYLFRVLVSNQIGERMFSRKDTSVTRGREMKLSGSRTLWAGAVLPFAGLTRT